MSKHPAILRTTTAAAMLWLAAACADTDHVPEQPPEAVGTTNLIINLSVGGSAAPGHADDSLPVHDCELIHTVRIIILNSRHQVEHNSLWDLTVLPAVMASGRPFPVEADDDKTIILLCNEADTFVYKTDTRQSEPATSYFSRLFPATGPTAYTVDLDAIRSLELRTADNPVFASGQMADRKPLPMAAIYEKYHIARKPVVEGTFFVHRAAAKYTYRLTNDLSPATVAVNKARINFVADRQWLFPHATWKDSLHSAIDICHPVPTAKSAAADYLIESDIAVGDTRDFIIYLPEGTNEATPYRTGLQVNHENDEIAMHDIEYVEASGGAAAAKRTMKDLPRNTNLVINGSIGRRESEASFIIHYTVCSWWDYETDIPDYN